MPILAREAEIFPHQLLDELDAEDGVSRDDVSRDGVFHSERQWWTIYVKSRQEKALARQLLGYEIPYYLPLVADRGAQRARKACTYRPLFQGYVFLYGTSEERVRTLTTNRISRILPVEDQLGLFRDLQRVHRLLASGQPVHLESQFQPGDLARIKSGVLEGLEGTIVSRRSNFRLLIAVRYINQGVSIAIDENMVERL